MIVSEKQLQDERAKLIEGGQLQEPSDLDSAINSMNVRY